MAVADGTTTWRRPSVCSRPILRRSSGTSTPATRTRSRLRPKAVSSRRCEPSARRTRRASRRACSHDLRQVVSPRSRRPCVAALGRSTC
jgi:hypothetical protein